MKAGMEAGRPARRLVQGSGVAAGPRGPVFAAEGSRGQGSADYNLSIQLPSRTVADGSETMGGAHPGSWRTVLAS